MLDEQLITTLNFCISFLFGAICEQNKECALNVDDKYYWAQDVQKQLNDPGRKG